MYEFESQIRYSEVDSEGKLTWLSLMDYFQDCSVFHSESVGRGVDYWVKNHVAWVLSSWQIRMEDNPSLAEKVLVQTWPYDMRNFFGFRNFAMADLNGKRYAYANSIWVLIDTQTGRPIRVTEDMAKAFKLEAPIDMECSDRKMKLPEEYEEMDSLVVPSFFIDTNQHMNNSKYVAVAAEYLPEDFSAKELRVEYRKSAMQGDIMIPRVTLEDEKVTVALVAEDATPYAIVQFRKD